MRIGLREDDSNSDVVPTKVEVVGGRKTLWDWMELVFVPATLAGLGFWFQAVQESTKDTRE